MNEYHFDAEITLSGQAGEGQSETLNERVYATDSGAVRVRAHWTPPNGTPAIRVPLHVVDERANGDARDIPAFVELFFHDAFLLHNLARPGSFAGVVSVSGGTYRVRELTLDARLFTFAKNTHSVPLQDVVRWYDSLQLGTRQLARSGVEKALFHLLHLARGTEDDTVYVLRLAQCAEALGTNHEPLFALRDSIARGTAPVFHPMADDVLDEIVEDPSYDWTAVIDDAAGVVIGELQARVQNGRA